MKSIVILVLILVLMIVPAVIVAVIGAKIIKKRKDEVIRQRRQKDEQTEYLRIIAEQAQKAEK